MTTPRTILQTTDDVIDALGGNAEVAKIVPDTTPNAVRNWRTPLRGKFPTDTFWALYRALRQKKLDAPLTLWGMREPKRRSA